MITGFEKIVEERIKQAQKNGEFDNLPGSGKPLLFENDGCVSGELSTHIRNYDDVLLLTF